MAVDPLAGHRLAGSHVALDAAIRDVGRRARVVILSAGVASGAEFRGVDRSESDPMLVVVTGRAQTPPQSPRGRITDEASSFGRGRGESLRAERHAGGSVVIQHAQLSADEMPALECLLVLGLVASPALSVLDG
jgi:hypothetical protein